MPNLTSTLKQEISRLARKELRNETETLKKTSARYRSEIATLKRRIDDLERHIGLSRRARTAAPKAEDAEQSIEIANGSARHRFSARSLAAHRKRLGLSAAEFGKLVGVSAQSVYNWEAEKARPREKQLMAFAAIRQMGKRDAATLLNQE
jgi:DNA-binding transcriptional regulator YiaG